MIFSSPCCQSASFRAFSCSFAVPSATQSPGQTEDLSMGSRPLLTRRKTTLECRPRVVTIGTIVVIKGGARYKTRDAPCGQTSENTTLDWA